MHFPFWLLILSTASVLVGIASFSIVIVDIIRRPQKMAVMNLVWPLTALYSGVLGLWAYQRLGRSLAKSKDGAHSELGSSKVRQAPAERLQAKGAVMKHPDLKLGVFLKATTHCGAGCTLGDLLAEVAAVSAPAILFWLGYPTLFSEKIFATWILDFILAYLIGVAFQYFTIAPMRQLSPQRGIVAAIKADTFSLLAWQVGMYAWMGYARFGIFHAELPKDSMVFWFMMQIAMVCGAITSFPVNVWLVRSGIKEAM